MPVKKNRKLTAKQMTFAQEYVVDMDATAAALRAGYSKKTAGVIGYQLLQKPLVQQAVSDAQRARSARTGITQDRVVQEIARLAFASARDVARWNESGASVISSDDLSDDVSAAVSEVIDTRREDGSGTVRVKMHDKVAALEKLARHIGLYDAERRKPAVDEMSDDEIKSELAAYLAATKNS